MTTLPLDIWFIITEHLSLDNLASLYHAFATLGEVSSIAKRQAIKVLFTILMMGTPRIHPGVAYNSRCYKFGLKHPRAGRYWHHQDHGNKQPCGGFYNPRFPFTMQYSRTVRQNQVADTKSAIVISDNIVIMF